MAWHDSPASSAIFGSNTWHVTRNCLVALGSWELGRLRNMFRLRRRPGEGPQEYNQRTSGTLRQWFGHAHVDMAFHKVLRGIFKHAWVERQSTCNFGENPLQWARHFRDARWWESTRCLSTSWMRRREGVHHLQRGRQATAWENPFVEAFGLDWRTKLEDCKDRCSWMQHCNDFINSVCRRWGLPELPARPQGRGCEAISIHLNAAVALPPSLCTHPIDQSRSAAHGRLWIQVDCRAVAELMSGRTILQSLEHRPLFVRAARSIFHLAGLGWLPLRGVDPYILWSPREYNIVADHAVNATLDEKRSWIVRSEQELTTAIRRKQNIRVCVDGGLRRDGQAAAGIAMFAAELGPDGRFAYTLLLRQGRLLDGVASAFTAEACALEMALDCLVDLMS